VFIFCLPSAVPLTNVGLRAGKEGDRVYEWGHRIVECMVGRSALRKAEAGILIGTHNVTGR